MILLVCGTRPEAIKILPVLRELKRRKIAFTVIHTGQHSDLMTGTGLKPDIPLGLPGTNDPIQYAQGVERALGMLHEPWNVSWVVVQGDTASAVGGARWAVQHGFPLCHVEAGLRSHDEKDPWPEEGFRFSVDSLANLRCCPTPGNARNLGLEGFQSGIYVTGNTIVDALQYMKVKREPGKHVLVTLHRREAFGEPLKAIVSGLARVAREHPDTPFLWPVHPNPHVREAIQAVELPDNVGLAGPLSYKDFLLFLASAKAVLTDSGGVIEETCTLGVPTVIARDKTERPEAIDCGVARLAGKTAEGVARALEASLGPDGTCRADHATTFGDGTASQQIAGLLGA